MFNDSHQHEVIATEIIALNLTGASTDNFPGVKSGVASAKFEVYKVAGEEVLAGEHFNSVFNETLSCDANTEVPIELVALNLVSAEPISVLNGSSGDIDRTWSQNWTPSGRGVYCLVVHATDVAGNIENTAIAGPIAYTFTPPVPPTPPPSNPPSGGGGGGGGIVSGPLSVGYQSGGGLVLGASTEALPAEQCDAYLDSYIRYGRVNNENDVRRLQTFLRDFEAFGNLQETGMYDFPSLSAVNAFQMKYAGDILVPWGATGPTGYVYYTTKKKINEIYCKFTTQFPLTADQEAEIARIRALGETFTPASTVAPSSTPAPDQSSPDSQTPEVGVNNSGTGQVAGAEASSGKSGSWLGRILNWLFGN
ncbi:hypothetical protein A3D66_00470 [Candidatus Kaiserbacteria bacterium RIFCSPHIGHO2_02_FULL_50_9]|nr:MAG: hypothetical protein A3D66_00470 [Candidatus Kaiserbacteria bacterium RIFCSPHIGHO2_02_FULL_50_9]